MDSDGHETRARLTAHEALVIAEASLAVRSPGDVVGLKATVTPDAVFFGYSTPPFGLVRVGEGPLRVDRVTGEVEFLGSLEALDVPRTGHHIRFFSAGS